MTIAVDWDVKPQTKLAKLLRSKLMKTFTTCSDGLDGQPYFSRTGTKLHITVREHVLHSFFQMHCLHGVSSMLSKIIIAKINPCLSFQHAFSQDIIFLPILANGISPSYQLDPSSSVLRDVGGCVFFFIFIQILIVYSVSKRTVVSQKGHNAYMG